MSRKQWEHGRRTGYNEGYKDAANKYDPGGPRVSCLVIIGMMSTIIGVLALIVKII